MKALELELHRLGQGEQTKTRTRNALTKTKGETATHGGVMGRDETPGNLNNKT